MCLLEKSGRSHLTELTRLLFDLGPRKLILVEGPTDVEIFREWYRLRLSEMEFYPVEGHDKVESFLSEILEQSTTNRAYGIIDRDFRDEPEVETSLAGAEAHLFILRRYALENYLLEPTAVFEELRVYEGDKFDKILQAVEQDLLDLCRQLKPVMAANWVFWDERAKGKKPNYFTPGFPVDNRPLLIQEASKRLECSEAKAKQRINLSSEIQGMSFRAEREIPKTAVCKRPL